MIWTLIPINSYKTITITFNSAGILPYIKIQNKKLVQTSFEYLFLRIKLKTVCEKSCVNSYTEIQKYSTRLLFFAPFHNFRQFSTIFGTFS